MSEDKVDLSDFVTYGKDQLSQFQAQDHYLLKEGVPANVPEFEEIKNQIPDMIKQYRKYYSNIDSSIWSENLPDQFDVEAFSMWTDLMKKYVKEYTSGSSNSVNSFIFNPDLYKYYTLPEDFKLPEDFTLPKDFKLPEGVTLPEGIVLPDSKEDSAHTNSSEITDIEIPVVPELSY